MQREGTYRTHRKPLHIDIVSDFARLMRELFTCFGAAQLGVLGYCAIVS